MRMIGIIGGMSAQSTAIYYRHINDEVRRRLGGLHSAQCLIWSVDFDEIAAMQAAGQWQLSGQRLAEAARRLEGAGAEVIILATNTMHKVASDIQAAISIPMVHIADATALEIRAAGLSRPGLLATQFTMEEDFYAGRLRQRHGLDVRLPDMDARADIHAVIYNELCRGIVAPASKARFVGHANSLVAAGADCLILGCTEIGMLLDQKDLAVPVFDTALVHAEAAVDFALAAPMRKQAAE